MRQNYFDKQELEDRARSAGARSRSSSRSSHRNFIKENIDGVHGLSNFNSKKQSKLINSVGSGDELSATHDQKAAKNSNMLSPGIFETKSRSRQKYVGVKSTHSGNNKSPSLDISASEKSRRKLNYFIYMKDSYEHRNYLFDILQQKGLKQHRHVPNATLTTR